MNKSILAAVPAELRNNIWRYTLEGYGDCSDGNFGRKAVNVHDVGFQVPSLLLSRKQIRKEAGPIFCHGARFCAEAHKLDPTVMLRWVGIRAAVETDFVP